MAAEISILPAGILAFCKLGWLYHVWGSLQWLQLISIINCDPLVSSFSIKQLLPHFGQCANSFLKQLTYIMYFFSVMKSFGPELQTEKKSCMNIQLH